jgi:hypothetical protein
VNDTFAEDVASYARAVRAAFEDLPSSDSEELLDDLESHLEEVLAETGGPLAERLGPPEAYAEELRASAGLPPASAAGRRRSPVGWLRESWAGRTLRAVAEHPAGRAVADFLPQLRPAWWVLRGYLAVQLVSALLAPVASDSRAGFPLPALLGSRPLGLLASIGAVVGSVAIARHPRSTRRRRRLLLLGNVALGVYALVFLGTLGAVDSVAPPAAAAQQVVLRGLRQDGYEITNIYPFDAQGRPLRDVYLVDQDGNPIGASRYDHPEVRPLLPRDAAGGDIDNLYPQRQVAVDPVTGTESPPPTPGFQPPPTTTAPAPSTTVAPGTTTSTTTTTTTPPTTRRRR